MRLEHSGKIQSASLISATDPELEAEVLEAAQGWLMKIQHEMPEQKIFEETMCLTTFVWGRENFGGTKEDVRAVVSLCMTCSNTWHLDNQVVSVESIGGACSVYNLWSSLATIL